MENKNDKILENPYIKRLTNKSFDEYYMDFLKDDFNIDNVNYFTKIPIGEEEFDYLAKIIKDEKLLSSINAIKEKLLSNIDAIKK